VGHDEQMVEAGPNRIRLAIDFRALSAIEHAAVRDMPEIVQIVLTGGKSCPISLIAKVLWGMMLRHYPETTIGEATELVCGSHRDVIGLSMCALIADAFNLTSSEEKEENRSRAKWSIETFLEEWIALGGTDDRFWRQTPRSYLVCMKGMARAANREVDVAMVMAWHTAVFGLKGYAGKLKGKSLSDFLTSKPQPKAEDVQRLQNARAIHFFQSLKAKGVDVQISRRVN
jgi:hypothetical protein